MENRPALKGGISVSRGPVIPAEPSRIRQIAANKLFGIRPTGPFLSTALTVHAIDKVFRKGSIDQVFRTGGTWRDSSVLILAKKSRAC